MQCTNYPGWVELEAKVCGFIDMVGVTFDTAQAKCKAMGGTMIEPYNAQVTAGILALKKTGFTHLGMSDRGVVKGKFYALSKPNSPLNYTNWASYSSTVGSTQNCGYIDLATGKWSDNVCTSSRGTFCMKFKHLF